MESYEMCSQEGDIGIEIIHEKRTPLRFIKLLAHIICTHYRHLPNDGTIKQYVQRSNFYEVLMKLKQ